MNFDYGPFLELENIIDSGNTTIKSFAYTFRDSGRYAFTDSDDSDNLLLVTLFAKEKKAPSRTCEKKRYNLAPIHI